MKPIRLKVRFDKRKCCRLLGRCFLFIASSVMLLGQAISGKSVLARYVMKDHSRAESIQKIGLPMNPNSTIASDIQGIWHLPSEKAVCIQLQNNASCPHPAFIGRLAGHSLAMLDWKGQNDDKFGASTRCGSYQDRWLSAGTYFLDLMVLFCEDFGANSLKKVQNESEWLSFNFKNTCMEDPNRNRITGENSYILIEENITSSLAPMGRWIPPPDSITMPLLHRYQPQGCMRNPDQEVCKIATNGTTLWSYSFEWESEFGERWRPRVKNLFTDSSNLTDVCFLGWSHSRELAYGFQRLGLGKYSHQVKVKYPQDVNFAVLNQSYYEIGCRSLIIAVAQWPGSSHGHSPHLFDKFYSGMKGLVETAAEFFADKGDDVRVYIRSIHEIPTGEKTGSCPMSDWRSPVVMNGYSHLVEKAVLEVRERHEAAKKTIHYLDTSFIVSPMWDSARDWCHLPHPVTNEEALYIAAVISSNSGSNL